MLESANPCVPSPCGPFSVCRVLGNAELPSCTCMDNYVGSPPNCRPECTIDSECTSNRACLRQKCTDPCPGSCGTGAQCLVVNHMAVCTCPKGYTGDPFVSCFLESPRKHLFITFISQDIVRNCLNKSISVASPPVPQDACNPSPCGSNALCRNGVCSCLPEYHGDPYYGCRPECVQNPDCPLDKACNRNKCFDPCVAACGQSAECVVINHTPMCNCPDGMSGNAFTACYPVKGKYSGIKMKSRICDRIHTSVLNFADPVVVEPCNPSPCGPNSRCQDIGGQAVCSCAPGYIGNPPACRPECLVNSDCALNAACVNLKCTDPCPGSCGVSARCQVLNHNPICSCPPVFTGDPFVRCFPRRRCLLFESKIYGPMATVQLFLFLKRRNPFNQQIHVSHPHVDRTQIVE